MKRKTVPKIEELIPDESKRKEVLERLYKGDAILGDGGIFTEMLQTFVNAALEGEIESSLDKGRAIGVSNRRNGHTHKTVRSSAGPMEIHTPRDRIGEYDPLLIKKWERDLGTGIDDIIISLYARGHSVQDVRYQLRQLYGLEVSAGVISSVTDRVWSEIIEWQQRPLATCYAIIYLDAIHYKVRESGHIISKAVYTCYGVSSEGQRDVLGLYLNESEGARHWGLILEDIQLRGVEEVLFFCIDGLTGFKDIIEAVYPMSIVQRCIVHMVRSSTRFVSDKDRKAVCRDLRKIYTSANRQQAEVAMEAFGQAWDKKYKEIRPKWEKNWDELMAFLDYGQHIRRMIYTTNPVEALHRVMRKVTKSKGAWSSDKGLIKQLYLALMHNEKSWKRKAFNWLSIQRELIDKFEDRYERFL
jgi:transposase-like protein|tara:strand:+ start:68 stop:1309 length:1242 start_codon:yes stop_codon:yes gene_type:complete